jgi:hypothetical protein
MLETFWGFESEDASTSSFPINIANAKPRLLSEQTGLACATKVQTFKGLT